MSNLQNVPLQSFEIDFISQLTEFCLHEIALEGLRGCRLTDLLNLLFKSSNSILIPTQSSTDSDDSNIRKINQFFSIASSPSQITNESNVYRNYLWKLLVNQYELDFYIEEMDQAVSSKKTSKKSSKFSHLASLPNSKKSNAKLVNIVNDRNVRGFCDNYFRRKCVNDVVKTLNETQIKTFSLNSIVKSLEAKTFSDCLNEFGSKLIIVASQQQRNKVLCPSYKFLEFENLNDIEYCVLEEIARSRYHGIYSTGENGLTEIFDLVPKQLHYIVGILESHQLVKKQSYSSEKKRSVIHLARYAYKKRTITEDLCEYLFLKHFNDKKVLKGQTNEPRYYDLSTNIKLKLGIGNKRFKTTISSAEKQNIIKREFIEIKRKVKKCKGGSPVVKTKPVRIIKLTESYFLSMLNDNSFKNMQIDNAEPSLNADDSINDNSLMEMGEENGGDISSLSSGFIRENLGLNQTYLASLYTQIFAKVEEHGKNGISLKEIGTLFGLDFYKSRRMGANLQAHPEIVTIIKETTRMRAKYQTIMLRKFLQVNEPKDLSGDQDSDSLNKSPTETYSLANTSKTLNTVPELVIGIVKRDGQSTTNIQALISNRALARKKIILDYVEKHRICTKYELTKEIRTYETQMELKGSIDAKTTKRMLVALEKEKKLVLFEVNLKNQSYMCVRSTDVLETDPSFINYCSTFRRTFDSVDSKFKSEFESGTAPAKLLVPRSAAGSLTPIETTENVPENPVLCLPVKTKSTEKISTKGGTESKDLDLTRPYIRSIVEKLKFSTRYSKTYALVPKFQKLIILHRFLTYVLYFNDGKNPMPQQESENMETNAYSSKEKSNQSNWKLNIPSMNRTCGSNKFEDGCIFISEIFSHMPLSIFSSIIVINFHVPGLLALLKDQDRRHILVKDLPPSIIAPLIYERRYLQRMLSILQLLGCMGLITFVESPCKTNQSVNRDVQSQMIYVHRKAAFYDTSTNKSKDWSQLKQFNKSAFKSETKLYEKCLFEFTKEEHVVDYWRKLLHVSMNSYKFCVGKYLHESKNLRQNLLNKITSKSIIENLIELWPIEKYGDQMGPGGYDSQLFLHSFKNWTLPTNVGNAEDIVKEDQDNPPAITKEAQSIAPYSELCLTFPFGVFRGIENTSKKQKKKTTKRKIKEDDDDDDSVNSEEWSEILDKSKATIAKVNAAKRLKSLNEKKPNQFVNTQLSLKIQKAKYLLVKSKSLKAKSTNNSGVKATDDTDSSFIERRATWNSEEDRMILLIKVTALFFLPKEKSIPFKLISDTMHNLMPNKSLGDKKVSSYGRRIKILMKSKMNNLFVSNKLELCRQDKDLEKKYYHYRAKLKRNYYDQEQVELYTRFITDIQNNLLKKRSYSSNQYSKSSHNQNYSDNEVELKKFELPQTLEEFNKKFIIRNSNQNLLAKKPHFQQPTTDYEITCNTVHSAIHSSILINDKNPRVYESFNLFDKYSSTLLNDVISRMSNQHRIIAPTKYHELKKKNVTAFSKHIGKAYHVSQRYNYKWTMNTISSNVLTETAKFKDELVNFKRDDRKIDPKSETEMFDCTDKDDLGMTSFLAHTIDNSDLQVQIDVPNKIWVSKII